jgi:hypothetical protein
MLLASGMMMTFTLEAVRTLPAAPGPVLLTRVFKKLPL